MSVVPAIPAANITVSQNITDATNTYYLKINSDGSLQATPDTPNVDNITLVANSSRAANIATANQVNNLSKGVLVYITTGTFGASAAGTTITIYAVDPVTGNLYALLANSSLAANTTYSLLIYPGVANTAGVSVNAVLPHTWQVQANATNWGTGGSAIAVSCALLQ